MRLVKILLVGLSIQFSLSHAEAAAPADRYYGADFVKSVAGGVHDENLKIALFKILSSAHVVNQSGADLITDTCPETKQGPAPECYQHRALGYNNARRYLFGQLHLKPLAQGYAIHCVYCDTDFTTADFPKGEGPAPGKIPSPKVLNAEHTWPQSKFSKKFDTVLQKSDLHILFPVQSKANSLRSNHPFGDVIQPEDQVCPKSELGWTSWGDKATHFDPPANHRGNAARALFYFSVRYKMPIDDQQESTLRKWHEQDPPDGAEQSRNDEIEKLQGDRNPFIDHPELVDSIKDF